jgi:hypothetical protein
LMLFIHNKFEKKFAAEKSYNEEWK